jgi:lactate dehydrogenase-like 2-hydroxyacid dehydrogenase
LVVYITVSQFNFKILMDIKANMKVGICGAGQWGTNLIREVNRMGQLVVVCEQNHELWNRTLKNVKWTDSYESLLTEFDIDTAYGHPRQIVYSGIGAQNERICRETA